MSFKVLLGVKASIILKTNEYTLIVIVYLFKEVLFPHHRYS